jgi:hypothetical protein
VLNPVARIDQHIMDDSDLAGPFLFCALFGTFLLLVRPLRVSSESKNSHTDNILVRQALVRLRLRPRHPRRHQPQLRLLNDVPSSHTGRSEPSTTRRTRRLRLTPLLDPHNRPLQLRPRLLPSPPSLRIAHWRSAASRLAFRILPGQLSDRVVHILQLWHVLQCGQDDGDERPGSLSPGAVLCWLWYYGDLQQQGEWKARGDEGWCLSGNRLIDPTNEFCMRPIKSGIWSDA